VPQDAQQRREVDDHADDPRARPADLGHGDHQRAVTRAGCGRCTRSAPCAGYRFEERFPRHCRDWSSEDPTRDSWHDCLIWVHQNSKALFTERPVASLSRPAPTDTGGVAVPVTPVASPSRLSRPCLLSPSPRLLRH
jgi:hypothetical protein